jgi:DHA1 family tetracycline resistance protein-like MFS transporter
MMLFIARMIDGVFGGVFTIAKAIVSDIVPPRDRGIQMANIGVSHVLASLIGPGIGGILYTLFGIMGPGLFAAGLTGIAIILTYKMLEETWSKEKRMLQYKIDIGSEIKIRKNKNAIFFLSLFGFHSVSFMIVMSSISFYGATVLGLRPLDISLLLTTSGIFRAIIRFTLFKPTLKKFGEDNAIRIGLTMFIISFFLISFATNLIILFILIMIISFAASLTRGPMNSKISQTVSPKDQGKINGLSSSLDTLAQILGTLIGPFIIDILPAFWLGIIVGMIGLPPFLMVFQNISEKVYTPREDN